MRLALALALALVLLASCTKNGTSGSTGGYDAGPLPDGAIMHPCSLPGAVVFTASGVTEVPGGPSPVDLSFLHLPPGFCAHYFGVVENARQLRFAPGGELFVASPTTGTTGGGQGGKAAIVVLPDDDHDGVADTSITFLGGLGSTQGLMFAKDHFYFQDGTAIRRVPYAPGDRQPSAAAELVADVTLSTSTLHWPKTLDMADDGTIYVGNGGDQYDPCDAAHTFRGGILKLDGTPGGTPVAKGLRNPIAVRCAPGHDRCFAVELAKDYTAGKSGREKLLPIRAGDDWGFPCCATKDTPYGDIPATDCSKVTSEDVSFLIGDTPFGVAFEPGRWTGTWAGRAYVPNHGAAGTWAGARMVAVDMDPTTGLPLPGSNINGKDEGGMADFATGWDDGTLTHGRPAAVEFSPDGRLFLASDTTGLILWIAQLPP